MKTKPTLSIDKELVEFARHEARSNGKSVSGIFSEYLLTRLGVSRDQAIPKVSTMLGSLRSYEIDDSKAGIHKSYAKK